MKQMTWKLAEWHCGAALDFADTKRRSPNFPTPTKVWCPLVWSEREWRWDEQKPCDSLLPVAQWYSTNFGQRRVQRQQKIHPSPFPMQSQPMHCLLLVGGVTEIVLLLNRLRGRVRRLQNIRCVQFPQAETSIPKRKCARWFLHHGTLSHNDRTPQAQRTSD